VPFETSLKIAVDTRGAKSGIKSLDSSLNKLASTASRSFGKMEKAASSVANSIFSLKGAIVGLGVGAGVKGIVDSTLAFERMQRALEFATGSAEQGRKEFDFLVATSSNLGTNILQTGQAYAKFAAAAKGSAYEGQKLRDIFVGISKANAALSATSDQSASVFTAFQQIMQKGKLTAEELTGQLGESMTGALGVFAAAAGKTKGKLLDLMAAGKIGIDDVFPNLADKLENTFGGAADRASKSSVAAFNRLQNSWDGLLRGIGSSGFVDMLTNMARNVTEWVTTVASNWGSFQTLVVSGWGIISTEAQIQTNSMKTVWSEVISEMEVIWNEFMRLGEDFANSGFGQFLTSLGKGTRGVITTIGDSLGTATEAGQKFIGMFTNARQSVAEFEAAQARLKPIQFQQTTDQPLAKKIQSLKAEGKALEAVMATEQKRFDMTLKEFEGVKQVTQAVNEKTEAVIQGNEATKKAAESTTKLKSIASDTFKAMGEGAMEYAKDAGDAFKNVKNASQNVFKSLEGHIAEFIKTGKFNFSSFADSVINELANMAAKAAASGIAGLLGGVLQGAASSFGESIGASFFAKGGVVPHARGNIVSSPQVFPMANGKVGLRGESGPEAVIPLTRTASGNLGVASVGGGGGSMVVNIIDQRTGDSGSVQTKERETPGGNREMDIFITERVNAIMGSGAMDKQFNDNFGVKRAGIRMGK
jgi:tape measure domain-containing protein